MLTDGGTDREGEDDITKRQSEESRQESHILTFNIGGTKFQTSRETIQKYDTTNLHDDAFLMEHYNSSSNEYFFDRDPEMFRSVLNFLRFGKLHLPANLCGPAIKEELDFWGLDEGNIEACCWSGYNQWTTALAALEQLEKDRKQHAKYDVDETTTTFHKTRMQIWRLMTIHNSSLGAKIYGWVSLLFVMIAIFSFCAATHPIFRVPVMRRMANSTANETELNATLANETVYDDNQTSSSFWTVETDTERHPALVYIDLVCLIFFTIEYVIRFCCAPRKLKFVLAPLSIIDLLAILPDYIEYTVYAIDPEVFESGSIYMNFMPLLRLMRAFRIFRLIRHFPGLWIMFYTLKASFKDLSLMLIFLLVGMLLFSSLIYFVDDRDTFTSIPHGFWWSVVTMTTVGYGDMYPQTTPGYFVGALTAVCGVLLIGFTIPALVNNFALYYQHVEYGIQKEKMMAEKAQGCSKVKPEVTSRSRIYKDPDFFHEHLPLYQTTNNGHNK